MLRRTSRAVGVQPGMHRVGLRPGFGFGLGLGLGLELGARLELPLLEERECRGLVGRVDDHHDLVRG